MYFKHKYHNDYSDKAEQRYLWLAPTCENSEDLVRDPPDYHK